jgi:hypothetical protein
MATDEVPGINEISQTPGLAGGPGPTPPGVGDGTPKPVEGDDEGTGSAPQSGAAQKRAGEVAERSAGTRQADVEEAAQRQGDPEPDGAEEPRRHAGAPSPAWRDPEEPDPS